MSYTPTTQNSGFCRQVNDTNYPHLISSVPTAIHTFITNIRDIYLEANDNIHNYSTGSAQIAQFAVTIFPLFPYYLIN